MTWPLSDGSSCVSTECECTRLVDLLSTTLSNQLTNVIDTLGSRTKSEYSPVRVGRDPMMQAETLNAAASCVFITLISCINSATCGICSSGANERAEVCS